MRHGGGSCGEAAVVRRLSVVLGGIESSSPGRRACVTARCAAGRRLAMTTDRGRGAAAPAGAPQATDDIGRRRSGEARYIGRRSDDIARAARIILSD